MKSFNSEVMSSSKEFTEAQKMTPYLYTQYKGQNQQIQHTDHKVKYKYGFYEA